MKTAVIVFPGSNCDRDAAVALEHATGKPAQMVWHGNNELPDVDLVVLPGGFSYGDYLRSGAISARSPIMKAVVKHAEAGRALIGICNGFQILTETGLLPGALMRNANLHYICKTIGLEIANNETIFTSHYKVGEKINVPIAHHDGNYFADDETLDRLEGEARVAFRYTDNPNGSARDIAGILNAKGNVLGMMPHPERVADEALGGTDGTALFASLVEAVQ